MKNLIMSKKGVELTLNTIVIAAIVLVVLAVLVLVFTGQMGDFIRKIFNTTSEQRCADFGTIREMDSPSCESGYTVRLGTFSDIPKGKYCCVLDT